MKYIETSKKINLTKDLSGDALKKAIIERLRRAFDIDVLNDDQKDCLHVQGTSGRANAITRSARVDLNIKMMNKDGICRIFVHGHSQMARSLLITYVIIFLSVLMVGLLPGSIETNGENSGAMDTLVLLLFGVFILFDINNKVEEPKNQLNDILNSLETEFG